MNQGGAGLRVLNKALLQRLNPDGQEIRISPEQVFRLGDRVLVTQNNYRLGLFNGEVGWTRAGSAQSAVSASAHRTGSGSGVNMVTRQKTPFSS